MKDSQANQPLTEKKIIIITSTKSVGIAILLTFFFGPIGMFYSTIWGAIIMLIVALVSIPFALVTLGIPYFFIWVASIIWGALAANSYNKKLLSSPELHIL